MEMRRTRSSTEETSFSGRTGRLAKSIPSEQSTILPLSSVTIFLFLDFKKKSNGEFYRILLVDGVKTAHGVETFRPNEKAFIANKDKATELRFKEGEIWELYEDGKFM